MSFRWLPLLAAASIVASAQQAPKLRLQEVQNVEPTSYKVQLVLDPAKTDFSGSIAIDLNIRRATNTIWLNASEIQVQTASVQQNGISRTASVKVVEDFTAFSLGSSLNEGSATLRIKYTGKIRSPQPQGIFSGEDNGNKYLFTQFEATDARDAFPCFDEPSYKVPWQLTLVVPLGDAVVSNTPDVSSVSTGQMKTVTFQQTKPLPSYLIAFAVGPFEFVPAGNAGRNHVPVRIVVPKGRADEAKFAASVTAQFIDRLEDYFGIPYPYPKCDQVALLKADFGAMENAGMVTYEPAVLLAKPSQDTLRRQREYVAVAFHELAHQWFGDLVTLAWWNDVWLNEAFASWMEQKMRAEWNPKWNHAEDVVELDHAEGVDILRSSRQIRQEIKAPGDIDNAFDAITYQKGAAVIGMFEHWMGSKTFRSGIHTYLEKYSFKIATTDDLLSSLDAAAHRDVKHAFSTFIDQPGIPIVRVEEKCGAGSATVELEQHRLTAPGASVVPDELWQIPFCVRYGASNSNREVCELITQRRQEWKLPAHSCPEWLNGNADSRGYYRVDYGADLFSQLLHGDVQTRLTPSERTGLVSDASAEASTSRMPYSRVLAMVPQFASDPDESVLEMTFDLALRLRGYSSDQTEASGDILPQRFEPAYRRFLSSAFGQRARKLGWMPKPGDGYEEEMARSHLLPGYTIFTGDQQLVSEAKELASDWLNGKRTLDPTQVGPILDTQAAFGDAGDAGRFRNRLLKTSSLQDRDRIRRALRYFRDPQAVNANFEAFVAQKVPDSAGRVLLPMLVVPETQKLPLEFVEHHFDALVKVMPFFTKPELPAVGSSFCDVESRQALQSFFAPRANVIQGSRRVLDLTLERIDSCIALKSTQKDSLERFFEGG